MRMYIVKKRIIKYIINLVIFLALAFLPSVSCKAKEQQEAKNINITIENSNGSDATNLRDVSYDTEIQYKAGDTIKITSEEPMAGIYIIWNSEVSPWKLLYDEKTVECGKYGFLHEYIELDTETKECVLTLEADVSISDIYAYSKGSLPSEVQIWQPPCEKADILVFSTHADDEILFMGGVLVTYGGQQELGVEVVYMTNYWNGAKIREHEKLDGIWTCGVRNYPVNMPYDDLYAENLEQAMQVYSEEAIISSVTEAVRRFKPQVVVTQDLNGEYGHGGHRLLAKCVCNAVDNSSDAEFREESAKTYGTWDVPKTYLHLYENKKLKIDLRKPLKNMNNQTAIDIAKEAYTKHVSQQWCWYYVSDEYEYSCNDFGLYRTIIGDDTGKGDMMENLTSYKEQARIEKEKEEAEAQLKAEAEEQSRKNEQVLKEESIKNESKEKKSETDKSGENGSNNFKIIFGTILLIIIILLIAYFYSLRKRRKKYPRRN